MSYIGRQLNNLSDRVKLDSITASATATYNLLLNGVAYVPSSAESLTVSLNGVIQSPIDSYTCSSSQIIFASTLSASDSIDFILAERSITLQTPSSGSVNTEQLANSSVTNTKVASSIITGQTAITSLADTDKFLVSDASDSGNLKYVEKQYLPSGTLVEIAEANVTSNVGSYYFSNVFSSTYDSYFLDLRKVRFAVDAGLQLRFLSDTGTSEFSIAYYQFVFYGLDNAGNEERDTGNGDTKFVLGPATDADSSSDGGITGNMYFYNPLANNGSSVNAVGQFAYRDTSNVFNGINFAGNYSGTSPRYGFVLYGGQQIAELRATLYGIVK